MRYSMINHLAAVIIVTILCLLNYASVQQGYRTAADDPQIQIASEIKDHLEQSHSIENIFPQDTVELTKSLEVFAVLYDQEGHVIRSSAVLNSRTPAFPKGVLDQAALNGQDRVTWQPQKNVRMAVVVMKANTEPVKYVVAGRSLREVEVRENNLLFMVFIGWVICMAVIAINAMFNLLIKRQK